MRRSETQKKLLDREARPAQPFTRSAAQTTATTPLPFLPNTHAPPPKPRVRRRALQLKNAGTVSGHRNIVGMHGAFWLHDDEYVVESELEGGVFQEIVPGCDDSVEPERPGAFFLCIVMVRGPGRPQRQHGTVLPVCLLLRAGGPRGVRCSWPHSPVATHPNVLPTRFISRLLGFIVPRHEKAALLKAAPPCAARCASRPLRAGVLWDQLPQTELGAR